MPRTRSKDQSSSTIKLKVRCGSTRASIDESGIFGFGIDFTKRANDNIAFAFDFTFATTANTAAVIDLNAMSFGQLQQRNIFISIDYFS
jgi:hypothetical protein